MKKFDVAIFGYGTVGHGIENIIKTLPYFNLKYVFVRKEKENPPIFLNDIDMIIKDSDIIFECLNGLEPANEVITKALTLGKCIISSNKMVVSTYLDKYIELEKKYKGTLEIEATVAGGIPFLDALLKLNKMEDILGYEGIFNGTSNYILSSMEEDNLDFNVALKSAQDLGFAEFDPSNDILGYDAKFKGIIANSLSYKIPNRDIEFVEGISKIKKCDLDFAKKNNYVIKHLVISKRDNDRYDTIVSPTFIPKDNYLSNIKGASNAQIIKTKFMDEVGYYGKGAGMYPTAHAMVDNALDYISNSVRHIDISDNLTYEPFIKETYIVRTDTPIPYDKKMENYFILYDRTWEDMLKIRNLDKDMMIGVLR